VARLVREYEVDVEWHGFELHAETPTAGLPIEAVVPAARLEAMREYMARFAAGFGVTMGFPSRMVNTRAALAVAELARECGVLDAYRTAAMDAHWRDGRDIGDPVTLAELAFRAGLGPEAALAALTSNRLLGRVDATRAEASTRGVTGIPTFFIGGRAVVGCQPYPAFEAAAQRAGATRRRDFP
jgi:predicted DsbA family dithiol-disulfide isomerase